jgi:hypothetical protein
VPTLSTLIRRPASEVFRFLCDWRNYERLWGKPIQILNPESAVSTRLGQVTEFAQPAGKVVIHGISTVTRFEEFRLVEWDTSFPKIIDAGRVETPPFPKVLVTCEFSEQEAMTRLKVSVKAHGKCPVAMKLILMVALEFQRKSLAKCLRAVKTQLESGSC